MAMQLHLLGTPLIRSSGEPLTVGSLKAQALLWYLAAQPGQAFSRSHLGALLWEGTESSARQNLSTVLSRLRHALPVFPLTVTEDCVAWDPAAPVEIDLAQLSRPLCRQSDLLELAAAAELWRGPFLNGFSLPRCEQFELWMVQERHHWTMQMLLLLDRLTTAAEDAGQWDAVMAHSQRAVTIDPVRERFHRSLMRSHYERGDSGAALEQYQMCQRVLREELEAEPDPCTTALRDAIAAGTLPRRQGDRPLSVLLPKVVLPETLRITPADPPLVGRTPELNQLPTALQAQGGPPLVLVHGDAGMGKTRLVKEVIARLWPKPQIVIGAVCSMENDAYPFSSLALPLAQAVGASGAPASALPEVLAAMESGLPRPALLIMEDVQWIDLSSLHLLARLARCSAGIRICLTARTADLGGDAACLLRRLQSEGLLTCVALKPMTPEATLELLHSRGEELNGELARAICRESQGNPFFALELLTAVRTSTEPPSPWELPLPPAVQTLVADQVARLSPEAQLVLRADSLLAEGTAVQGLQAVTGLSEEALMDGVEELVNRGFAREQVSPQGVVTLVITHPLVRRTVVETTSQTRLAIMRGRALAYMEGVGPTH